MFGNIFLCILCDLELQNSFLLHFFTYKIDNKERIFIICVLKCGNLIHSKRIREKRYAYTNSFLKDWLILKHF